MISTDLIDQLTDRARADDVAQLVVGAIITDHAGKALLLQRPHDDFMGGIHELPSGKVDPGERLLDALAREITEETGLTVADIVRYLGHFDYTSGSGKLSRQFNFYVTTMTSEPVKLTEHTAYQWVPLTDEPPVTPSVAEIWTQARLP